VVVTEVADPRGRRVGDVTTTSKEHTVTTASPLTMDPHRQQLTRTPTATTTVIDEVARVARDRLSPLLARAAELDLDDGQAWAQLRTVAHATTAVLTAAEVLPPHLRVRHGDPPVVVARTLATAWRWIGAT
jgi:hypothetical protein